jgi:hypothetical protein
MSAGEDDEVVSIRDDAGAENLATSAEAPMLQETVI